MSRRNRLPVRMERGISVRERRVLPEGIVILILFLIQAGLLCYSMNLSYLEEGSAGVMIGVFGVIGLILCVIGLIAGIRKLRRKPEKKYLLIAGVILNLVYLAGVIAIFVSGILELI